MHATTEFMSISDTTIDLTASAMHRSDITGQDAGFGHMTNTHLSNLPTGSFHTVIQPTIKPIQNIITEDAGEHIEEN